MPYMRTRVKFTVNVLTKLNSTTKTEVGQCNRHHLDT